MPGSLPVNHDRFHSIRLGIWLMQDRRWDTQDCL